MLEIIAACLLLSTDPVPAQEPQPAAATAEPLGAPAPEGPAATEPATTAPPATPAPAGSGAAPLPQPATAEAPPAPPSEAAAPAGPPRLVASLGLLRSFASGSLSDGIPMNDLTSPLLGLRLDAGFRFTPRWVAAIVAELVGGGTPGLAQRQLCDGAGVDCTVSSARLSLEGRYVFTPEAPQTWWAGAGFGGETTRVTLVDSKRTPDYLPTYKGALFPRLSGGWDHRVNRWFGWGFDAALSTGRYTKRAKGDPEVLADLPGDPVNHTWLDLGVRVILFP
jgi:hypothetical protein